MDGSLSRSDTRVNVDRAAHGKAIHLFCAVAEEHRLSLQDILHHLLCDTDGMQSFSVGSTPLRNRRYIQRLYLNIPFLAVFVHEVWQHAVVESSHALPSDFEALSFQDKRRRLWYLPCLFFLVKVGDTLQELVGDTFSEEFP